MVGRMNAEVVGVILIKKRLRLSKKKKIFGLNFHLFKIYFMQEIIYHDNTILWFGAHKGKALKEVPEYLLWLWKDSKEGATLYDKKLARYIKENYHRIELEAIAEKQKRKAQQKLERR